MGSECQVQVKESRHHPTPARTLSFQTSLDYATKLALWALTFTKVKTSS